MFLKKKKKKEKEKKNKSIMQNQSPTAILGTP